MSAPPDDPFQKLEQGDQDRKRGRSLGRRVAELFHDSNAKFKDDYAINKRLRRENRSVFNLETPFYMTASLPRTRLNVQCSIIRWICHQKALLVIGKWAQSHKDTLLAPRMDAMP